MLVQLLGVEVEEEEHLVVSRTMYTTPQFLISLYPFNMQNDENFS